MEQRNEQTNPPWSTKIMWVRVVVSNNSSNIIKDITRMERNLTKRILPTWIYDVSTQKKMFSYIEPRSSNQILQVQIYAMWINELNSNTRVIICLLVTDVYH